MLRRMTPIATLAATENLLVLAAHPGEEVLHCGGLIAHACARGRPPLVALLTDGAAGPDADARAADLARRAHQAAAALGLPPARLFLFGLHPGAAADPVLHAALIDALCFLMWSRDCGVLVAPPPGGPDHAAARNAAQAVAARTGIGTLAAEGAPFTPPTPAAARKLAALAAYGLPPAPEAYGPLPPARLRMPRTSA